MTARRTTPVALEVFLRACSTLSAGEWRADGDLLQRFGPDEEAMVSALAGRHGVRSLVGRSLAWAAAAGWTPTEPTRRLLVYRDQRLVLQLRRRAATAAVISALRAAGVEPIVFKGFVLAEEVFGDLSARSFGDCDLLVRPENYPRAMEVLAGLGYRPKSDARIAELMRTDEHGVSFRGEDGVAIDLHWALANDIPMRWNDLIWQSARAPEAPGALEGLRLSPELTLVHLAAHFAHHDFRELRPLVDFYVAACGQDDRLDPERVGDLAATLGLAQTVKLAALICRRRLRPRAAIERFAQGGATARTRMSAAALGRRALLAKSEHPLAVWRDALRRRLMIGAAVAFARWLRTWVLPSRESLAQRFARPYRWTLYPRYYLVQAYRVTTQSRRLFVDLR